MMNNIPMWIMVLLSFVVVNAYAQESKESAKIQYLISSVENLKDAKFIRNGVEYDSRKAADHLRLKLKIAGDQVKTADDFIRICGSKSYMSGKAYQIQFANGITMSTEVFFRDKLKIFAKDKP